MLEGEAFVTRLIVKDETGSTNEDLLRMASEGSPAGTVVIASAQTAGRGRLGRVWHSPHGLGLYLSTLHHPRGSPETWSWWGLAAAVAACDTCQDLTRAPVRIRWPNDLYLGSLKIAGVLAETKQRGDGRVDLVVGVGVNVYQTREDFPEELRTAAGSLGQAGAGSVPSIEALGADYLKRIAAWDWRLQRERWDDLRLAWEARAPDARGRRVLLRVDPRRAAGSPLEGVTEGLGPGGTLRIRAEGGAAQLVHSGDSVEWVE